MKTRKDYQTPEVKKVEFDYSTIILTSGKAECNEVFDESRWNSPGLALCGYKYTN